jgi:hypothetical protein
MLQGLPGPVNDLSRGAPADDIIYTMRRVKHRQAWPVRPAAARPGRWCRWSCRRPRPGRTGPSCCCAVITTGSHVRPWRRRERPCANCPGYRTARQRGSTWNATRLRLRSAESRSLALRHSCTQRRPSSPWLAAVGGQRPPSKESRRTRKPTSAAISVRGRPLAAMSVAGQIQDHQARCLAHLISLRMLARDESGTPPARWVVVEIARATSAILAEAEAAGRAVLAAAGGGRNRGGETFLRVRLDRLAAVSHARDDGLMYILVDIPGLVQPQPPPARSLARKSSARSRTSGGAGLLATIPAPVACCWSLGPVAVSGRCRASLLRVSAEINCSRG